MMIAANFKACAPLAAAAALLLQGSAVYGAQAPAAQPQRNPQEGAPIDLTGNWVAIVNEDYLWRMKTPAKGDFPGIPLNAEGQRVANAWDPATDGSCKAYGVGGVMRMPGRVRISWEDQDTLKVETDAGVQTRRLEFTRAAAAGARTLQGASIAQWQRPPMVPAQVAGGVQVGNAFQPPGGSLRVVTNNHTGGWVRKNGVPYSENAVITEYYDRWADPKGAEWFSVTTVVDDPQYYNTQFITSSHFRKESDGSKWMQKPCKPE
jgi:hypothetical protein